MNETSMNAIVVDTYGGAEVLKLQKVSTPLPKQGEVILEVVAAGVNPIDWKLRSGMYREFMPVTFPWIPGIDVSGIVVEVGEGVTSPTVGQAVLGTASGAYAEYAVAQAKNLVPKPAALGFEEAATIPVGALTALSAIRKADISSGQEVAILGAAGGVGHFAVQLALLRGARVVGTASEANVEWLKSLGVERVVNYRRQSPAGEINNVDVVIDTVGGPALEDAYSMVKRGGAIVTVAGQPSEEKAGRAGAHAASAGQASATHLVELVSLVSAGKLTPVVGKRFTLERAADAHVEVETRRGRGRIVLTVGHTP